MTDGLLSEPGILLRMVSPDAPDRPAGTAASATPAAALGAAALRAALLGFCGAWFVLAAAHSLRAATGIAEPRWIEWVPASLAGLGACAVGSSRAAVGSVLAFAALAASALAGSFGAEAWRVPAFAAGLGAVAGLHVPRVGGGVRGNLFAGAAVVLGALTAVLTAPWTVASTAMSIGAVLVLAISIVVSAPTQGALACRAIVGVFAAMVVSWFAAPASLWSGTPALDRGLHLVASVAASWFALSGSRWLALGALTVVVASTWFDRPAELESERLQALAVQRDEVAAYDRSTQSMLLLERGEIVDAAGGEHTGAELGATIARALMRPGDRVLVLGVGTGRLPPLVLGVGAHEVEVVDPRAGGARLRALLAADGPVADAPDRSAEPRVRRRTGGIAASLARLGPGSRQGLVLPEAARDEVLGIGLQAELRRVAGEGFVLQAIAGSSTTPQRLAALFAAAVAVHPWSGVVAVGDSAWLLSLPGPPDWASAEPMSRWEPEAKWTAHAAHLGDLGDLQRAVLGRIRNVPSAATGEGDSTTATLRAWLEPLAAPEPDEAGSVLMRWLGRTADLRAAASAIAAMADTPADRARAQAIAAKFLHIGAPSAILQAALGLPDTDGVTLVAPVQAVLRAHAIDPTFFAEAPPVFTGGERPTAERGDLEDFARLPAGERLATLCSGDAPMAVALRARFPSRCARVLLEAFARGPVPPAAVAALRELADPFVLAEAVRIAALRNATAEALAVWRGDLPLPALLRSQCEADPALRPAVASALAGRRDAGSVALLADFLESSAIEVRRAAATSLRATTGDAVPYDPDAPRSAVKEAAERLRSLHNRKP